jgi:AcrR family transcriptional regulator
MASQIERRTTTRSAIVSAAVHCYLEAGDIDVSLDSIALEAGVAKATIIYHFGSRIGLLLAVADRLLSEFLERLGPFSGFSNPEDAIRAYLEQALAPTARLFSQVGDALTYAGQIGIGLAQELLVESLRQSGVTGCPNVVAAAMQTMVRQIAFGYVDADGIDTFIAEISRALEGSSS